MTVVLYVWGMAKQHYEILDGLRGIAAVSVVVFHFMEIAVPDYSDSFIAHAYLAVDFFFCLSGFVIAYAYDSRLRQIGVGMFFKLRLIRLHPLVIVGSGPVLRHVEGVDRRAEEELADVVHRLRQGIRHPVLTPCHRPVQ